MVISTLTGVKHKQPMSVDFLIHTLTPLINEDSNGNSTQLYFILATSSIL